MKRQARGEARRQAILAYVRKQWAEASFSPTVRDIAREVGCSIATAHRHIQVLANDGLVHWHPRQSRSVRPVQPLRET